MNQNQAQNGNQAFQANLQSVSTPHWDRLVVGPNYWTGLMVCPECGALCAEQTAFKHKSGIVVPSRKRVWLCFEKHDPRKRGVWAVKFDGRWFNGDAITSVIPLQTTYRGPKARQPKAYLHGWARSVRKTATDRLVIS